MASVQGTYQLSVSPNVTIQVSAQIIRVNTSIYARWRVEIPALLEESYPYSIIGSISFGNVRFADSYVFKEAYPGTWRNAVIKYFPSFTEYTYLGSYVDPDVTSLPVSIRFTSSDGTVISESGEEDIPPFTYPTAPTTVDTSMVNVGNVTTNFTLSWSGETQGTRSITQYDIQHKIGISGTWTDFKSAVGTSSASINLSTIPTLSRGRNVYFRVRVADDLGNWSDYSEATASIYYANLPIAPTYVVANKEVVAHKTDTFTLSWSGARVEAGTITGYNIYYLIDDAWVRYTTVNAYSTTINLSNIAINRGDTVSFCVTTLSSLSLESEYSSEVADVLLANLPTAPTWVSASETEIKRLDTIDVTWGGATAGTGGISHYITQYRRYHNNSWSDWTAPNYRSSEYCMCDATAIFPYLQGGDLIDMRVATVNTYDLQSSSYRTISNYITVKGGGIRIKVGGVWHEGTPWVKISGTWEQGEAYKKLNGNWHEGI